VPGPFDNLAFRRSAGGAVQNLGLLAGFGQGIFGSYSVGTAINDSGVVAGYSTYG
jgi:hypothetical protein